MGEHDVGEDGAKIERRAEVYWGKVQLRKSAAVRLATRNEKRNSISSQKSSVAGGERKPSACLNEGASDEEAVCEADLNTAQQWGHAGAVGGQVGQEARNLQVCGGEGWWIFFHHW